VAASVQGTSVKRLLLVDDDPGVLFGLRRVLDRYRGEWQVVTAPGAERALSLMAEQPFDVVVSDTLNVEETGRPLLEEVQRLRPETVRVLITGAPSPEAALRALPSAHQVLSKPCGSVEFEQKLVEICWLGDLVSDAALKSVVGGLSTLSARPAAYDRLRSALAQPHTDLVQVGRLVEADMALTAKILQVVNSSFFGLARQMVNVGQAVAYLGTDALEALVLAASLGGLSGRASRVAGFDADALQAAAEDRALRARAAAPVALRDGAFTAALLSEIGQLVLACARPAELEQVLAAAAGDGPLQQVERQRWGFDHARVGAYLLGLWGLPVNVVHAVAYHHEPCGCELCTVIAAVPGVLCLPGVEAGPDGTDRRGDGTGRRRNGPDGLGALAAPTVARP
jgi:HD-like signal output (HDOD) protein